MITNTTFGYEDNSVAGRFDWVKDTKPCTTPFSVLFRRAEDTIKIYSHDVTMYERC